MVTKIFSFYHNILASVVQYASDRHAGHYTTHNYLWRYARVAWMASVICKLCEPASGECVADNQTRVTAVVFCSRRSLVIISDEHPTYFVLLGLHVTLNIDDKPAECMGPALGMFEVFGRTGPPTLGDRHFGLAFILPLIAMLTKEREMLQFEHRPTMQQNTTDTGPPRTPLGELTYSAPRDP